MLTAKLPSLKDKIREAEKEAVQKEEAPLEEETPKKKVEEITKKKKDKK